MSDQKKKKEYQTTDIPGSYSATVLNARLVEMGSRRKVELVMVVDRHGEKVEAKYYGDTDGEYSNYAIDSIVKAGFIGSGWNDLKKGFNKETFEVVPFNVSLQELRSKDGDKLGNPFLQVKYINSPEENVGPKSFEGTVNGMEGSFAAAKTKLRPKAQQTSQASTGAKVGW